MIQTKLTVSVLLSVHNGESYLPHALNSVLTPDDDKIELIAVDDGSSDKSGQILSETAERDSRVKVLKRPHAGLTASLNAALAVAGGDLIARLDADDRNLPGRFDAQRQFLMENRDVSLVGSNAVLIDEHGREAGRTKLGFLDHHACVNRLETMAAFFPHSSWMVRSEVMRSLGGYDEFFKKAQDYEFMLRLSERYRMACLPAYLVEVRKTRSSISFDDDFLQYRYAVVALLRHRCRSGRLRIDNVDNVALLDAVGEWFEDLGLRPKMLAQRALSFARIAYLGRRYSSMLRNIALALRFDPLFLLNRRSLARIRSDPISSIGPYLS